MKVRCIKTRVNFAKGEYYDMVEKFDYNKQEVHFNVYVVKNCNGYFDNFAESTFDRYFIDIKEDRKIKIKKLNET